MSMSLEQIEFLRSADGAEWLEADLPADDLAASKRLRREISAEEAQAVLAMRHLRGRARRTDRFGPRFTRVMLTTEDLLSQASSTRLAVYTGAILARRAGASRVLDLGCGMGADLIGIAKAGADVAGYDNDPRALACAGHNVAAVGLAEKAEFVQADVTELLSQLEGAAVHADPARRTGRIRHRRLGAMHPPAEFCQELIKTTACGSLKLSPAVHWAELAAWPETDLETISEAGVCKQLRLWWPIERDAPTRRATVVWGPHDQPMTASIPAGVADPAEVGDPEAAAWILEPDPAVIAADAVDDLAALFGLTRMDRSIAWLLGDEPITSPLVSCFRVLDRTPGRDKDVARAVGRLGGGPVEVKPRGLRLNTDHLQAKLRGRGEKSLTVLWAKIGHKQRAYIAERAT